MPVGQIAGIRFFVSYSVFVALAVVAGMVAMVSNLEGNRDLPLVAAMSVVIWIIGWSVQTIVHMALHLASVARTESITLGLLGIEMPNPLARQYPWSAAANLAAACFSLTALVLFGASSLAIHLLSQGMDLSKVSVWMAELATPSFGLDSVDNGYLTATWLFLIQAACQAYPLPRNMGRGAIASAVALFTAETNDEFQIRLLRRILQFIALITLIIAAATMIADNNFNLPRWPILALLSAYLWYSTKKRDLRDWITSVHLANADPVARPMLWEVPEPTGFFAPTEERPPNQRGVVPSVRRWVDSVRMQGKRRRARAVLKREHEEASDAARLDDVLELVSRNGTQGLSAEDKALLERVSATLRHHRQQDEEGDASGEPAPES